MEGMRETTKAYKGPQNANQILDRSIVKYEVYDKMFN